MAIPGKIPGKISVAVWRLVVEAQPAIKTSATPLARTTGDPEKS
jgi:hypothetical protein